MRRDWLATGATVAVVLMLLLLALTGCGATGPTFLQSAPPPVRIPPVPMALRDCLPPTRPPPVPAGVLSPEILRTYAWAEAEARWRTAERLTECRGRLRRLNAWIADLDAGPEQINGDLAPDAKGTP